jgi:hypothetical protein
MLGLIVSCMLSPPMLTVENVHDYMQCREERTKLSVVSSWYGIIDEYFAEADVIRALGIVYCESRGKPLAVGINTDGTKDVGLWQFNDNTWSWLTPKLDIISDRTNPEVSTAVAAWLVYNDGWHHWNSSKHCWKGTNNEMLQISYKD